MTKYEISAKSFGMRNLIGVWPWTTQTRGWYDAERYVDSALQGRCDRSSGSQRDGLARLIIWQKSTYSHSLTPPCHEQVPWPRLNEMEPSLQIALAEYLVTITIASKIPRRSNSQKYLGLFRAGVEGRRTFGGVRRLPELDSHPPPIFQRIKEVGSIPRLRHQRQ
jgi:hypothetical protein